MIDKCDCSIVSCVGPISSSNSLPLCSTQNQRQNLQITLTICFSKYSSGSQWYQFTKWNKFLFTLYLPVSTVSWFCPSPWLITFLVNRGLWDIFFCPYTSFTSGCVYWTWGRGRLRKTSSWNSDSLKYLSLVWHRCLTQHSLLILL